MHPSFVRIAALSLLVALGACATKNSTEERAFFAANNEP
jgi:hypothetical protein